MSNDRPEGAEELFQRAKQERLSHKVLSALRLAEEAAALKPNLAGLQGFRARCLFGIGRLEDALDAANEELANDAVAPGIGQLKQQIETTLAAQRGKAAERQWVSSLSQELVQPIEEAVHRYTYRGHSMIKNPYDMALYPLLLWNLKPQTIFEIGSFNGASALWMADILKSYEVDAHIWSLDIVKVTAIERSEITFLAGSGRELQDSFPKAMLDACRHPLLVIDDADHTAETSSAVLEYFHPYMQPGDYFVIEDALTAEGPRVALSNFLPMHSNAYMVDAEYCDFYGYNATWCVNGFLKRLG